MKRGTCRDEVLDAMRRLEARHGRSTFDLHEIVVEVRSVADFPESTVRTQVVSVMCANAPVNHANHTNDLERVDRGRYRRVSEAQPTAVVIDSAARRTTSRDEVRPCREPVDISGNLREFLDERDPTARYASFDYCFNYFQSFRERGDFSGIAAAANIQLSCLQLGFYLASWGMLRGSTDLLKRSVKHLEGVVSAIASAPHEVWSADADSYTPEALVALTEFANETRLALSPGATSDTLVTKIMLGVFGNVPAFDTYFVQGSGLRDFNSGALRSVERFYREHSEIIDLERARVWTFDFDTGAYTHRNYTRAKLIDMIFFIEGSHDQVGSAPGPDG